jgi:hypothetical protein
MTTVHNYNQDAKPATIVTWLTDFAAVLRTKNTTILSLRLEEIGLLRAGLSSEKEHSKSKGRFYR